MAKVKYFQNQGRFMPIILVEDEQVAIDTSEQNIDYADLCILDKIFSKYNRDDRPDGQIRRSMSVGDIVSIDGRAYLCDLFGWTRL